MSTYKKSCELYILWNDGSSLIVNDVTEYGCSGANDGSPRLSYYFISNKIFNAIPMNNVKFFGDKGIWDNSQYKEG